MGRRTEATRKGRNKLVALECGTLGKIQTVIHTADKFNGLVESRPFECDLAETDPDSVIVAGLKFYDLIASLDPTIEEYDERAYEWVKEKGCGCGDDFSEARSAGERAAFDIGLIFGARMAAYSDD